MEPVRCIFRSHMRCTDPECKPVENNAYDVSFLYEFYSALSNIKVLPDLISKDQTGFMAGRYIGENIRIIYDLVYYTEKENVPGLLLLVDFEKAFDLVSWSFINKVLDFYNLGSSYKKWINHFNKNINSCVHINGHLSELFFSATWLPTG